MTIGDAIYQSVQAILGFMAVLIMLAWVGGMFDKK